MRLPYAQIAAVLGTGTSLRGEVSSWSIDSRTIEPGALFFALGPGNDYVAGAFEHGASAAIADRDLPADPRVFRVPDTLAAMQTLARFAAAQWNGDIVGVTGSAGKTSTKDVIAAMLGSAMPAGKTVGNFNNHIGVPLSVLRLPQDARVAVLEYGMNHAGEIRDLTGIARPRVAVVTNVGYAHIENFENGVEGIAAAKRELVEALPAGGAAVLNFEDERVRTFSSAHTGRTVYYGFSPECDVRAENVTLREDGVAFRVAGVQFGSALVGRHAVLNILAGIAVARLYGIDEERLVDTVHSLQPGRMRGERLLRDGVQIINDCYNSNPDAARAMLEVLRDVPARRHIAVLGEMLELGRWSESLHREVGRYAARSGVTVLAGIRGAARALVEGAIEAGLQKDAAYFFSGPAEAGEWLRTIAQPGDAILFKGSRGTRVEQALEKFLE